MSGRTGPEWRTRDAKRTDACIVMNPIVLLYRNLRDKGVVPTARIVASHVRDLAFDIRYGTRTTGWEELNTLTVLGPNKAHGERYQPTRAWELRELFRRIQLPNKGTFVDIGSGKGRVLILAAEYGFQRLIGVEFSKALCDVAEDNLRRYRSRTAMNFDCRIIHSDAMDYEFDPTTRVIFLFNPFDRVVMESVAGKIRDLQANTPESLYLIYNNPAQREVLDRLPNFKPGSIFNIAETEFCTYIGSPRSAR